MTTAIAITTILIIALAFLIGVADSRSIKTRKSFSGRHANDFRPLHVLLKTSRDMRTSTSASGLTPFPIPANQSLIGGDYIDGGYQAGPSDPSVNWGILTAEAQQYLLESGLTGQGFQTRPANMYIPGELVLEIDLTDLFPVAPRSQGECNSCWALSATEHLQAVLIRQGYLSGPWLSTVTLPPVKVYPNQPLYHHLSVQQVIDCSNNDGCSGGSVVDAWRWMMNSSGVVPMENYPPETGGPTQPCQPIIPIYTSNGEIPPPYYQPGEQIALNIVTPCFDEECPGSSDIEDQILQYLNSTGIPLVAYVDASNWANATSGFIFKASQCSSSGSANANNSHVVQIVGSGYEVATGHRFILVRNSWSMDWNEGGYIRLEYGQNTCGWTNYLIQADVPPALPVPPKDTVRQPDIGTPKRITRKDKILEKKKTKRKNKKYDTKSKSNEELYPIDSSFVGLPPGQCEAMCIAENIQCYETCSNQCASTLVNPTTCWPECIASCSAAMLNCNEITCGCTLSTSPKNISSDCSQMCFQLLTSCTPSCQNAPGCAFEPCTICSGLCTEADLSCSDGCCVDQN